MKTAKILLLAALLTPAFALAGTYAVTGRLSPHQDASTACDKIRNDAASLSCWKRQLAIIESELTAVYRVAMADAVRNMGDDKELMNAQRAWVNFKETDCKVYAARFGVQGRRVGVKERCLHEKAMFRIYELGRMYTEMEE